jgi:GT2 family glycosyltransferase
MATNVPNFKKKLTVIIVSYNVRYFLDQALRSVRAAAKLVETQVFVVDNASSDGSAELVSAHFPEVFLIKNTENVGFSTANNQAIRASEGDFVLLLNPDTLVEADTFRKCVDFMDAHPRGGGLGVRMLDGGGRFLPESKRGFPSPWVAFCKTFGLARIFSSSRLFNEYHLGYLPENETNEVAVLSGAFMMMRRAALDEVGLLDEAFFMYGEDIDLSYRLTQGGWTNYYFSDTQIIHYKGESTKKGSLNYVKVFYQAMIIFAKKHFTGGTAGAYIFGLEAAIWLRAGMTIFGNFIEKIGLPLLDAALISAGLMFLKKIWAVGYFNDPDHFTDVFGRINLPMYLVFWLGGIFLSGGYDEKFNLRRLFRGLFVGTICLLATYGLLDLAFRSSRILLLLGAAWAVLATVGLRAILHFIQFKNVKIGRVQNKNLVIVGAAEESARAKSLIFEAGVSVNFIGNVVPHSTDVRTKNTLGDLQNLSEILRIYRATEVIFCSKDVSAQEIIGWMTRLPANIETRILPESSLSIIGSQSKNAPGELYTIDVRFAIASPLARRNKVLSDYAIALLIILLFPIMIFLENGRRLLKNLFSVIFLQKTWVGYRSANENVRNLPKIKPAVFAASDGLGLQNPTLDTFARLDFLYAKDWIAERDWAVVLKVLTVPRSSASEQ